MERANGGTEGEEEEVGMRALTDECPPPPFYWELVEDGLQPPSLSSNEAEDTQAISEREYGGLVRILKRKRPFDPSKDYKAELRSLLKTLLLRSMTIASNVPTNQSQAQRGGVEQHEVVAQLNETLLELHNTLGEYRIHEARETIIETFKAELHRLHDFEVTIAGVAAET